MSAIGLSPLIQNGAIVVGDGHGPVSAPTPVATGPLCAECVKVELVQLAEHSAQIP